MLPKILSNGICSLNPDADRLTLSVSMEIDGKGKVVNHEIYESVIHSKARMVYSDVSDMLEDQSAELKAKYQDIYQDILHMEELARILRKAREVRGSLDFDFDEAYIKLNEKGIPISVLAATLGVPYQRLRRLEIGTRADPELEARATAILEQISPPLAA